MILDCIIIVILILPMAVGIYRGFISMFIRTLGWIAALIIGFFLTGHVSGILRDGFVGEMIYDGLQDKFDGSLTSVSTAVDGLPDIIGGGLSVAAEGATDVLTELITSMLISVISFLLIVVVIKIILGVVTGSVTKRHSKGLLGGTDKLLGLVAGFIEGILLVFIFLALLIPIVNFTSVDVMSDIVKALDESVIAKVLYDNNLLLLATGGLFS